MYRERKSPHNPPSHTWLDSITLCSQTVACALRTTIIQDGCRSEVRKHCHPEFYLASRAAGADANRVGVAPDFGEAHGAEIKKQKEKPPKAFEYVSALNLRADLDHSKILWLCSKLRGARVSDCNMTNENIEALLFVQKAFGALS